VARDGGGSGVWFTGVAWFAAGTLVCLAAAARSPLSILAMVDPAAWPTSQLLLGLVMVACARWLRRVHACFLVDFVRTTIETRETTAIATVDRAARRCEPRVGGCQRSARCRCASASEIGRTAAVVHRRSARLDVISARSWE
jgi:hypothetical protein